ncbi:hypothetical protein HJG53_06610 [Sphingomonas sp. ID1715]|uniref:hypothetical protein n=1 Tax=Sphingomonas sp. ID1715 TaxID=1656898 RepID=UPI001488F1FC|nr:hypothetical protein [Sphingomonas sp. ID1715]NNM76572.1 hypothetical protein [Sphingomonas sp. ID1715]
MRSDDDTENFIRSSFGSIWSLELLLTLWRHRDRQWRRAELIETLRASEQVLARSCSDLHTAGLIAEEDEIVRYAPASPEIDAQVTRIGALYASRPAFVRRLIVGGPQDAIERFADAFRFRQG